MDETIRKSDDIYILLDTVLATDVDKYSLASARCQPIWWTKFGEPDLFLAVAKDPRRASEPYVLVCCQADDECGRRWSGDERLWY